MHTRYINTSCRKQWYSKRSNQRQPCNVLVQVQYTLGSKVSCKALFDGQQRKLYARVHVRGSPRPMCNACPSQHACTVASSSYLCSSHHNLKTTVKQCILRSYMMHTSTDFVLPDITQRIGPLVCVVHVPLRVELELHAACQNHHHAHECSEALRLTWIPVTLPYLLRPRRGAGPAQRARRQAFVLCALLRL